MDKQKQLTRQEEIEEVFDKIETSLIGKYGKESVERKTDIVDVKYNGTTAVHITYSGSYSMGRFGHQEKCWIEISRWGGKSTTYRRIEFKKFDIDKVLDKVDKLYKDGIEHQADEVKKVDRHQKWKEKIVGVFGSEVKFDTYGTVESFEIPIETDTEYPNTVYIAQTYDEKFRLKGCGKDLTENQIKKIIEILKEVE